VLAAMPHHHGAENMHGRIMKKYLSVIVMISLFWVHSFGQNLGEIMKGEGKRVNFNRLSVFSLFTY
jgi:hypothetical protein